MTISPSMEAKLTTPKPHRKGASEERMFADAQKAKTNAALISSLKQKQLGGKA